MPMFGATVYRAMIAALLVLTACFAPVLTGCGGSPRAVPVTPPAALPAIDQIRVVVADVAQAGELGSGTEGLRGLVKQVQSVDSGRGDELLKSLDALEAAKDRASTIAAAQRMLEILGATAP
jgi:hypothetical protein